MATNIKEIAQLCGVSTATVSRVLNNKPDVSDEVRQRVLDVIRQYNFSPKLTVNRSNIIGVTIEYRHAISTPYISKILESIEDTAYESGYDVLILRNERLRQVHDHYGVFLRQKLLSGVIMLLSRLNDTFPKEIAREGFPHMVVSHRNEAPVHFIDADWYTSSLEATKYLIALGHTQIAFLQPAVDLYYDHRERLRGYQDALKEAGLALNPALIINTGGASPLEFGYEGLNTILNKNLDVTAVLTINDAVGGVIECLRNHNLSIPTDMSVITFDDSIDRASFYPSLSVIAQDASMLGRIAAKEVIRQIEVPESASKPVKVVLPTKFIIRQTVGSRMMSPITPVH